MYTNFTKEEKGTIVLLFLHGWGCDGSVFQSISKQLNATSYLLDLWGFGASEAPSTAWSVTDYARQLKAFCDSQGLRQFGIVCHSFGARVAVVFAAMYPDMVDRLLITGGAGSSALPDIATIVPAEPQHILHSPLLDPQIPVSLL